MSVGLDGGAIRCGQEIPTEDNAMVPFNDTSEMHHSAKASQPESTRHEGMLPFRARQVPMMSSLSAEWS